MKQPVFALCSSVKTAVSCSSSDSGIRTLTLLGLTAEPELLTHVLGPLPVKVLSKDMCITD